MKKIKLLMLALINLVLISSFISLLKKPSLIVCYEYEAYLGSLTAAKIANLKNWEIIPSGYPMCPNSFYLCGICFDDTQFTGTITQKKQQALNVLANYLISTGFVLPLNDPHSIVHQGKTITIYQRDVE